MGQNLVRKFITPDFQDKVEYVLHQALLSKETANFEFPLYTKKGEPVDILLNAATRRGADDAIVGVVGVGQNITELKKEQTELSRLAQARRALFREPRASPPNESSRSPPNHRDPPDDAGPVSDPGPRPPAPTPCTAKVSCVAGPKTLTLSPP